MYLTPLHSVLKSQSLSLWHLLTLYEMKHHRPDQYFCGLASEGAWWWICREGILKAEQCPASDTWCFRSFLVASRPCVYCLLMDCSHIHQMGEVVLGLCHTGAIQNKCFISYEISVLIVMMCMSSSCLFKLPLWQSVLCAIFSLK